MKTLLVLDADNTIFNTDKLFARAQTKLLSRLQQNHLPLNPKDDLVKLRVVDRELSRQLGTYEYDFELLARALALHSHGLALAKAISYSRARETIISDRDEMAIFNAVNAFNKELSRPVELLPGVWEFLEFLETERQKTTKQLCVVLISEGNPERIMRTLKHYNMNSNNRYFDRVILDTKSIDLLLRAKSEGARALHAENPKTIVVGDSIRADIRPGKLIGAVTIYKPSRFLGVETPSIPEEKPDYIINNLQELIPILEAIITTT